MNKWKIIERAKHKVLLELNGSYAVLVKSQRVEVSLVKFLLKLLIIVF